MSAVQQQTNVCVCYLSPRFLFSSVFGQTVFVQTVYKEKGLTLGGILLVATSMSSQRCHARQHSPALYGSLLYRLTAAVAGERESSNNYVEGCLHMLLLLCAHQEKETSSRVYFIWRE